MLSLTKDQARELLNKLEESDFIDSGSSRAVFELCYGNKCYAVKIALDHGGYGENRRERELYMDKGDWGLARIHAHYKNLFLVSEWVNAMDPDDVEAMYDGEPQPDWSDIDSEEWEYLSSHIVDVVDMLESIQGCTSDNLQIGCNENGDVVAYDYGYAVDVPRQDLVGNVDRYSGYYIKTAIAFLDDTDEEDDYGYDF